MKRVAMSIAISALMLVLVAVATGSIQASRERDCDYGTSGGWDCWERVSYSYLDAIQELSPPQLPVCTLGVQGLHPPGYRFFASGSDVDTAKELLAVCE